MPEFNPLDHPVCLNNLARLGPSTWIEHAPFAMYLIDVLRPGVFVELGTFYGVSYCAFCQAVKELGAATQCYGVDTWQGDPHAGFFGDDVLGDLRAHHDPLYGGFSRLMRMTFDEAAGRFEDGSVDLLHIDGYHTYEAVSHDFETWLPRLSRRGVVLFHDIAERRPDFGVWRFWGELKERYPSYEVEFGHGLGLLAVGPERPPGLEPLLRPGAEEVGRVREYFRRLGALAAAANEGELFRREVAARDAREAAEQAERAEQLRRAHPFVARASNFLQVWAAEGAGGAFGLVAAKVSGRARLSAPRAAPSRNVGQGR
jgi:hypothetical protein